MNSKEKNEKRIFGIVVALLVAIGLFAMAKIFIGFLPT